MFFRFSWRTFLYFLLLTSPFLCGKAKAQSSDPCGVPISVTPSGKPFSVAGGGGSSSFIVSVGSPDGGFTSCAWILNEPSFIHSSPTSGGGTGGNPPAFQFLVNFSVDPNPNLTARTGVITVTQTLDGSTATETISESAANGDFAIAVGAGQSIPPEESASYNITISRSGQFTGCVNLSASVPNGVGAVFSPAVACGNSATMTLTANSSACSGSFPVIVSGANGPVTHTASTSLTIVGDFSLSVNPSLAVVQGAAIGSTTSVTINRSAGYINNVGLSFSGPSDVSGSFDPDQVSGSSVAMTITAGASAPLGTFPVTITGNGGCISHSTTFNLGIIPAWLPVVTGLLTGN